MFELRAQRDDDLSALIGLAQRAWREVEHAVDAVLGSPLDRLATPSWAAHHEAVVTEACASDETRVVVAEHHDGGLVGLVAYQVHPASAAMSAYGEIGLLGVDPGARGLGVGRALLDRAVDDLRAAGAPVIMLETGGDDGHAPARALYESAGFTRLPVAQYWLPGAGGGAREHPR